MNKEEENKTKVENTNPQVIEEETFIADNDNAINLIPIMSKSEVVAEKKKVKLNITAIISLITFLFVTIGIVVFAAVGRFQVEDAQSKLAKQEQE